MRACARVAQPVLDADHTRITAMALSPSGRFLAVACADHQVKVFNVQEARIVSIGYGHSAPLCAVRWSPDEKQLVTGAEDCAMCVWNFYGAE